MKTYLSIKPVWLKPTAEINAFDGKSVVVIDGDERIPGKIQVSGADPQGSDAGLVSVAVWQTSMDEAEWTGAGAPVRASQIYSWQRYLDSDALPLIRTNDTEWSPYGELLLEIPDTAPQT